MYSENLITILGGGREGEREFELTNLGIILYFVEHMN